MAINGISPLTDNYAIRRQNAVRDPEPQTAASTQAAQPRPDARLARVMQTGRETSALLSTLAGPNLSFFPPPALPPGVQAQQGLAAAGGPAAGQGQRLNVPLQEAMQTGRTTSALLSGLMGSNERAFPAPEPPAFTQRQAAPGGVAPAAANTLPREGARLLETEQAGRTTSTLLSGLMAPGQTAGSPRTMTFAQHAAANGAGQALSAMRTAEQVMQDVGTATPSMQNMRIANEAYQMEAQAQRDFQTQRLAGRAGSWEWFA